MDNLFDDIPGTLREELFQTLVDSPSVRIERIVSSGHATPQGQWYDQPDHEWVVLLKGAARLEFDDGRKIDLKPGDWIAIRRHEKHRVAWTDPGQDTVWLAVHYR